MHWWRGLLVLAGVALGVWLAWPWAASAYSVERAGRWLAADGAGPAVERQLDRALRWDPHNAQVYRLRAQLYEQQGKPIAAVEALAGYVALRPADPLGRWALATACAGLKTTDLARVAGQPCGHDDESRQAALAGLLRAAGYSAASLADAGNELRQDGNLAEAEVFYRRAVLLDSGAAAAWYGLGQVREARGQREAALEAYGRATAAAGQGTLVARAHYRRGQMLANVGRWDEAAAELARAVDLVPGQGEYHYEYGWYLYKAGQSEDVVIAELETAARLMPRSPWPHVRLAGVALAEQDYTGMLARARDAVRVKSDEATGWLLQGQALARIGRLEEAKTSLYHAAELAPGEAAIYAELAYTFREGGDLEATIEAYKQAVKLEPDSVDYQLRLADTYRANGQAPEARDTYRRVLELDPGNPVATQALEGIVP
jgi:tetratricopeptide (TPR) repeat protein